VSGAEVQYYGSFSPPCGFEVLGQQYLFFDYSIMSVFLFMSPARIFGRSVPVILSYFVNFRELIV